MSDGSGAAVLLKVNIRLPGKGNSNSPCRENGPPNHLDDQVDSDQYLVNKNSLSGAGAAVLLERLLRDETDDRLR